jgi:hypothetical protein
MNRLLRDLGLILLLASLWAVSGYIIGIALETSGIPYPPLKIILASLNVIIGMLLFQGVTHDPTAERIFFEGADNKGEGDIRVGCLWLIPASLLLLGLLMWFWAIILRFIVSK